ncbi:MAG: FMN-binding glutamate synthase family protein [Zhaonellaceae bacterium]
MLQFLENWLRSFANEATDKALNRLIKDQYIENLFELVPTAKKVNPINLVELAMRASSGKPIARPLGSHIHFSPWEKLLFNPVHLFRLPVSDKQTINTKVTIGPKAQKPLELSIPIMIAGMSFGGALSKSAKIALAKAATWAGTATNTGEAGLLEEERQEAGLLIGQYNRGGWLNSPELYKQLDAIEIQLGQGAQGSAHQKTSAENIGEDYKKVFKLQDGEDAVIHSRLSGVENKDDFIQLVRQLKSETSVPVGLKIAATHHLERELQIALEAGVDFITLDGAEGGTHGGSPTLQDDVGLPTLFAVSRGADFLRNKGATGEVSLIAAGGLITPGQMLKAMALGAQAVYIGTAAIMALISEQIVESVPFEPPTSLVVYTGKITDSLDIEKGAVTLFNFLNVCSTEMQQVAESLGKHSLAEIDKSDLCALDPFLARAIGVEYGYVASEKQQDYFAQAMLNELPNQDTNLQPLH